MEYTVQDNKISINEVINNKGTVWSMFNFGNYLDFKGKYLN